MKFIIDLDGTLMNGAAAGPDSVEFIRFLNDRNIEYLVMTNSIKSPAVICEKLENAGMFIDVHRIMNPIIVINNYLKDKDYKTAFVVGSQLEIEQIDVVVDNDYPEIVVLLDFEKDNVAFTDLQKVFKLINNGTPVITASRSNYYLKNGERVLDTGAFVRLFEVAGDTDIEVFGKPSQAYFMSGIRLLNAKPCEVMVIGDDWKTDVKGAIDAGCQSVLIRSGKYIEGDEEKYKETFCVDKLMDIFEIISVK